MGARRHVPVVRAACVSGADLAAMAVASQAAPRAPWWLPWMIAGGGTLVLAVIFARDMAGGPPPPGPPPRSVAAVSGHGR